MAVILCLTLFAPGMPAQAAPVEGFASPQIGAVWLRDDGPVAAHSVARSWMWGPGPFYTDYEPLSDALEGNHLVQYFDKGRLEINDPNADPKSAWYVTSGLLVKEMVSGKVEAGGGKGFTIGPAEVVVAGDGGIDRGPTYDSGPVYAHFARLTERAANLAGHRLSSFSYLKTNGADTEISEVGDAPANIMLTRYEEASGHNWADVFWAYANSAQMPVGFNWLYTLGLPITEPYWIIVPVNGQRQTILVQLFERRTLTYNPSNPQSSQVEMGNVGRHYYSWRYGVSRTSDLATQYDATVTIGAAPARNTQVSEKLTFVNHTGRALDKVVMRAPWNHWKGVFTLTSVKVAGRDASNAWREGINLEITLPTPAPPGEVVNVEIEMQLKPRPVGGRTGYDRANDILTLGDMLPTLVPWQNGGWQYYPYSDLGDLGNNASASYRVSMVSAAGERLVVGGTGRVTDRSKDGTRWQFAAYNVRDVAYVVSPRFINPLDDASMTRQEGNVKMLAYFLPAHKADGQRQLQLVGPALSWFSARIGPYPFDTYTIAEMGVPLERTDNYAQEYPMSYFVPSSWLAMGTDPGSWIWYTPVHEVGHQWFYSTVGNNQLTNPWLDEAMTTYITAEYVRANFPSQYSRSWTSMTTNATNARPVSAGVYSGFASENQYTAAIYDSGAVMLDRVRHAMGDSSFYAALQDYYATYKFQRALPSDLTATFQMHTKADLGTIFAAYLWY